MITTSIEAYQVIEEVIRDIKQQGDFFIIEAQGRGGYVSYSRHCGGGAYQGAIRFSLKDNLIMMLDAIGGRSRLIREDFDLADPSSFEKMGKAIKSVIDQMHTSRIYHGSEGDIRIRKNGKYL